MIHGTLPMMRYVDRAEGIARGRQSLVRLTQHDFGYDLRAWHDYLIETNAGGYKWSNRHRGYPKEIESALSDSDWQRDVAFAVTESLLERLSERDLRQRLAVDRAEREWAGKTRTCQKCGTEFKSVGDRGQCTTCSNIFYASHPETGNKMWWLEIS
jgi:NADH pyrophosphatase NudC (nudix superfamily)